jgi:2-methylcitrate dehydratase PrpD
MNFGTDTKPLHAGFAAQAGILAAELARRGVSAREGGLETEMGFSDLYGGARPLELDELGKPFAFESPGVELKPYPSCRFTHRAIDAVLELRSRIGEEMQDSVESISCGSDPFAKNILIYDKAKNGLEAKFCLEYCVAVAWLDGAPGIDSFSDSRSQRADVVSLAGKVRVSDAEGPDEVVTFTFRSGRKETVRVRFARGSPERPLSEDELRRKVRALCEPVIGVEASGRLIASLSKIEILSDLDSIVGALSLPATSSARS